MKKALSLLLSIIFVVFVFTLSTPVAFAASYSGSCGSGIVWSLDTLSGTLTVSGSGEMNDYTISTAPSWDRYQSYIKSVVFSDGIENVGAYAFYNGGKGFKYKKLSSVDFGSVEMIGDYAFRGCAALSTVSGCDFVCIIGNQAFRGCTALEEMSFSAVIEIGNGAFCGCSAFQSIDIPPLTTTIGSEAFAECGSAESVTVPASVSKIGGRAFADCSSVEAISYNIRALSTASGGIFDNCGADSGITLNMGSNVISVPAELFSSCSALKHITGGANVTSINDNAFAHTGLTEFAVNAKTNTISDTAFADCQSLESFTVDSSNAYFSANSDGILLNKNENQIIRYPGGRTASSYTLPSSITSIAIGAFRDCKYLKTFISQSTAPKIPARCFADCEALTTVSLSSGTTVIDTYAFIGCSSLSGISMSGVTQINDYAFAQCDGFTTLNIPSKIKTIGTYAFFKCDGLTSLTVGSQTIGKYAFYSCDNLKSVTFTSTVRTIGESAFFYCSSLDSVTINSGVTTIEQLAFLSCSALSSVSIPKSVTSIGTSAFGFNFSKVNSNGSVAVSPVSGFKIKCYSGSQAYTYAKSNSITTEFITTSAEETEITEIPDIVTEEPTDIQPKSDVFSPELILNYIFSSRIFNIIKNIILSIFNLVF